MPVRIFLLTVLLAGWALAADVTGRWKAEVPMSDGNVPIVLQLRADGDKLSGVIYADQGQVDLRDGKIAGDEISFALEYDDDGTPVRYDGKGKVEASQIRFSVVRAGSGRTVEFIAKRAE
jgi:hypothetical protein